MSLLFLLVGIAFSQDYCSTLVSKDEDVVTGNVYYTGDIITGETANLKIAKSGPLMFLGIILNDDKNTCIDTSEINFLFEGPYRQTFSADSDFNCKSYVGMVVTGMPFFQEKRLQIIRVHIYNEGYKDIYLDDRQSNILQEQYRCLSLKN